MELEHDRRATSRLSASPATSSRLVPPRPGAVAVRVAVQDVALESPGPETREDANKMRRGWDSNPRKPCDFSGFQDRRIRPLCHPSEVINSTSACATVARAQMPSWTAPSFLRRPVTWLADYPRIAVASSCLRLGWRLDDACSAATGVTIAPPSCGTFLLSPSCSGERPGWTVCLSRWRG